MESINREIEKTMSKIEDDRTHIHQKIIELKENFDEYTTKELSLKISDIDTELGFLSLEEHELGELKKKNRPFQTYRIILGEACLFHTYKYISQNKDEKDVQKTIFGEIKRVWKILGETKDLITIMESDKLKEKLEQKNIYSIDEYVDLNKETFYAYLKFEAGINRMDYEMEREEEEDLNEGIR